MSFICKVTKFYKRCQREKTFCSIDGKYRAGASLHDSIASLSRNSIHLMREPSLLRDVFQQTNTFLYLYCYLYQSVYSAAHFTLIISHFSGLVITIFNRILNGICYKETSIIPCHINCVKNGNAKIISLYG